MLSLGFVPFLARLFVQVQDVLFPLAGDTSVNDGGLSFLLNMCLDLLALLHIC